MQAGDGSPSRQPLQDPADDNERLRPERDLLCELLPQAVVLAGDRLACFAATAQAEGVRLPVTRRLVVPFLHQRTPRGPPLGRWTQAAAPKAAALLAVLDVAARPRVEQAAAAVAAGVAVEDAWAAIREAFQVECLNRVARMPQTRQRRMTPGLLAVKRRYWNGRVSHRPTSEADAGGAAGGGAANAGWVGVAQVPPGGTPSTTGRARGCGLRKSRDSVLPADTPRTQAMPLRELVTRIRRAPRRAPCPRCGRRGRRKRLLHHRLRDKKRCQDTFSCLGDNEGMYAGFDNDVYRVTADPPRRDRAGYSDPYRFGSAHATGVNMAYGDGSVRLVAYDVDPDMFFLSGQRAR